MIDRELLSYVRHQLERGAEEEELKKILLEKGGWEAKDVDEAIAAVESGKQTAPPTPTKSNGHPDNAPSVQKPKSSRKLSDEQRKEIMNRAPQPAGQSPKQPPKRVQFSPSGTKSSSKVGMVGMVIAILLILGAGGAYASVKYFDVELPFEIPFLSKPITVEGVMESLGNVDSFSYTFDASITSEGVASEKIEKNVKAFASPLALTHPWGSEEILAQSEDLTPPQTTGPDDFFAPEPLEFRFNGSGAVDILNNQSTTEITFDLELGLFGKFLGLPANVAFTTNVLNDGGIYYLGIEGMDKLLEQVPAEELQQLTDDEELFVEILETGWIKIDPEELKELASSMGTDLEDDGYDISDLQSYFEDIESNYDIEDFVTFTVLNKSVTIDGVETSHLSYEVNVEKVQELAEEIGKKIATETMNPFIAYMDDSDSDTEDLDTSTMSGEMWVGNKDLLPYKITSRITNEDDFGSSTFDLTVTFSDYNEPIEFNLPEKSVDFMDIVGKSLMSARLKARDARRISDLRQIQLAQELYFDDNGSYSTTLDVLAPDYISEIPTDPLIGQPYGYHRLSPNNYCLGTQLETIDHHSAEKQCSSSKITPSKYNHRVGP